MFLREPMGGDGGGAGDALVSPPQVGDMAQKTISVPTEYLPDCKVGDTYTVKSKDENNVVLEDVKGAGDDEGYNADMVSAMKEGGQQ